MIPKIIHYCWFGDNSIPEKYQKYIDSWKKYCPDYEIRLWNEENYDFTRNQYAYEAYNSKQWAFVSDYARLDIIYKYGGIYLDTDVELIKPIDELVNEGGFICFQNPIEVTTGLGFGAEAGNSCIKAMLDIYNDRKFINEDGSFNRIPCPAANTVGLLDLGLKIDNPWCKDIQYLKGIRVLPEDYFNPLNRDKLTLHITHNTVAIHHYAASWNTKFSKGKRIIKLLIPNWYLNNRTKRIALNDIKKIKMEITNSRMNKII